MKKYFCNSLLFLFLFSHCVSAQQIQETFYFENGDSLTGTRLKANLKGIWLIQIKDGSVVTADSASIRSYRTYQEPEVKIPEVKNKSRFSLRAGGNLPLGDWAEEDDPETANSYNLYAKFGFHGGLDVELPVNGTIFWRLSADYSINPDLISRELGFIGSKNYQIENGTTPWRSLWILTGPSGKFGDPSHFSFEPGLGIGGVWVDYPSESSDLDEFENSWGLAGEIRLSIVYHSILSLEPSLRYSNVSYKKSTQIFSRKYPMVGLTIRYIFAEW